MKEYEIADDVYLIDLDNEEDFQNVLNMIFQTLDSICQGEVVVQVPEKIKNQIVTWALSNDDNDGI